MKMEQILPATEVRQDVLEEQKSEIKHIGQLQVKPGHTCFQINIRTMEISEAQFEKVDIGLFDKGVRKKLIQAPDCVYITALNKKNAVKVFQRDLRKMQAFLGSPIEPIGPPIEQTSGPGEQG